MIDLLVENQLNFITCGSIVRIHEDKYLIGWGPRTWLDRMTDSDQPFFYFPDFFLSHATPWFQHENSAIIEYSDLKLFSAPTNDSLPWHNPYLAHFEKVFNELQNHFTIGSLKKAVPYVFEMSDLTISKTKLISALKKIIAYTRDQPLHVYGFWDHQMGILGASPEILFRYTKEREGIIETIACAGTQKHGESEGSFTKDPKELYEHQIVIDGICESLTPLGHVHQGKMSVLKLPRLSHLITPIEVAVNREVDFLSIVKNLHPTQALGAFPKKEGGKWLKDYQQKIPRGRYGAPIGYVLERGKQAKCIVGIRNVQWDQHGAKIGAGCGIVRESLLDKEWREICLKISSTKEMMSL